MAHVYVDSNAVGTGTGANWANAYTTLDAALTAKAAGDQFWVAHNHAETAGANKVETSPGTLASPCTVMCVNSAGTVPPVAADLRTTGSVTCTGAFALTFTGCAYYYGLAFNSGTGAVAPDMLLGGASNTDLYFKSCAFSMPGTAAGTLTIGGTGNNFGYQITWDNTTYSVGQAATAINMVQGVKFVWKNTPSAIVGATLPTNLFSSPINGAGITVADGIDLSALVNKTLVNSIRNGSWIFKDCKLPASITIASATTSPSSEVYVTRSASGATAYTAERHDAHGDQTTETTIVRTGGSTRAIKVITTANAKVLAPFNCIPLVIPNTVLSTNRTVTVYGIWGGGAVPNNNDIWIEVGYLGSAATPLLSFASTGLATPLTAAAATTADGSVWGGSTTAFKMVATLSAPQPALAGEMYIAVKCGAASSTFYVDQIPVLG